MNRKFLLLGACALLAVLIGVWVLRPSPRPRPLAAPAASSVPPPAPALYVGAEACKGCHAAQYQNWLGSHHQLAMQEATAATVLANAFAFSSCRTPVVM
jgi:hypothetical protein